MIEGRVGGFWLPFAGDGGARWEVVEKKRVKIVPEENAGWEFGPRHGMGGMGAAWGGVEALRRARALPVQDLTWSFVRASDSDSQFLAPLLKRIQVR